jgi:hypothetical protein
MIKSRWRRDEDMFFILDDLIDSQVIATDGEIGKVRNFFFDDQSWTIRYLVVDVGSWLSRRDVLISVTAIDQPDWQKKIFRVRLTKEQVRHGPDVDSKRPVSRQQEIAMREHFGWPAALEHVNAIASLEFPPASFPVGREFPVPGGEDPHLRSFSDIDGYEVWSHYSAMGRLESFVVDEASWHLRFLDVKMGDWLHRRSMLVPTSYVAKISWANHRVNLRQETGHARP